MHSLQVKCEVANILVIVGKLVLFNGLVYQGSSLRHKLNVSRLLLSSGPPIAHARTTTWTKTQTFLSSI